VKVLFNPQQLTYKSLVRRFLANHGQAFDLSLVHGGQYSTVIFCVDSQQERQAKEVIADTEKASQHKTSVYVRHADTFWKAEEYHQHYYRKHGLGTCAVH
jgi:peptide methionine sulfoxide reductase MsrA